MILSWNIAPIYDSIVVAINAAIIQARNPFCVLIKPNINPIDVRIMEPITPAIVPIIEEKMNEICSNRVY